MRKIINKLEQGPIVRLLGTELKFQEGFKPFRLKTVLDATLDVILLHSG